MGEKNAENVCLPSFYDLMDALSVKGNRRSLDLNNLK